MFMACCFSARVKVENPTHNGLNSEVVGREEVVSGGLSNKVSSSTVLLTSRTEGEILQSNNLKCFTFNEVKTATRNFHPSGELDERGFGRVFKGWIDEHTQAPTKPGTGFVVAVMMFNNESNQEHSEWLAKINYLGQLRHPNLVKLIGYCLEGSYRILVYEFMTKGNLDNHLFRSFSNFLPLTWKIRMKIALDAAKGLAFLHSDEVGKIHGDFKTSKILIDSNYNAKLFFLGFLKVRSDSNMSDYDVVDMGPQINATPEYIDTGHLTKESDLYNFGVVLLEIMSGKRAVDKNRPLREQNLVEWAKPLLNSKRKISQVMDVRIEGQYSSREAMKLAHIVIQCLSERTKIEKIVRSLKQLQNSNDKVGGVGSS